MPAPVTTIIFLLFATASDRFESARLVDASDDLESSERVTGIAQKLDGASSLWM